MKHFSILMSVLVVLFVLSFFVGCGENNRSFELKISFPDQTSETTTEKLWVYAILPNDETTCQNLMDGSASPNDGSNKVLDSESISNPFTEKIRRLKVPRKHSGLLFFIQGEANGTTVFRGCTNSDQSPITIDLVTMYNELTVIAGSGGAITVPSSSPITVNYGVATTITAKSVPGFHLSEWTVVAGSGVSFGSSTSASTTVTLTGGNATIQANFISLITTVAGTGSPGYDPPGDGGLATSALLFYPSGVAVDSSNNLYIADDFNARVRKVDASGLITTVVTPPQTPNGPLALAIDSSDGSIYIGDEKGFIYKKDQSGFGEVNITPTPTPPITIVWGVAVDSGFIYFADRDNHRVLKVAVSGGPATTVAGTGTAGYSPDGTQATAAMLSSPQGVAVDKDHNIYISDSGNGRVRKVGLDGHINTVAGNNSPTYSGDGVLATSASIHPNCVAFDSLGNYYIADSSNNRIYKVDALSQTLTLVAGNGVADYSGDNGPPTSAALNQPTSVAVDSSGNIFIADRYNHRIRKVY